MKKENLLVVFAILSFIVVLKVLICSCFLRRRRQQNRRRDDTLPILEEVAERLYDIHHQRIRSRMAREPPPTFEDALRYSRPVSYIDIEEPPPPSYDDYLNSHTNKNSNVTYSSSVNPSADISYHHDGFVESSA